MPKRIQTSLTLIMPFVLILLLATTQPAQAGGIVGDGTPGSCTEAAFISALAGGGSITFNCGGAKTIVLTAYQQIADNTTIDGGGVIVLSGSGTYLFQVFSGKSLTLHNITLANGSPANSGVPGAIENFGTTLIVNSQLINNRSLGKGGAISNYGTLTITNSTLSNNAAANAGGGLYNDGGTVTINGSLLAGNAVTGTSAYGGGIANQSGSLTMGTSTLNGNLATGSGGGIYGSDAVELTNVTLNNNRAAGGGGLYQGNGPATLKNVTVAGNRAAYGAGVYKDGASTGNMYVWNSLLAYNTTGNCDGVVNSLGYNLSSDHNCAFFTQTGDQQAVALPIGPLANNGGPTWTQLPSGGNPAIDHVPSAQCPGVDQRGVVRPQHALCDSGAVEVTAADLIWRIALPVILR